MNRQFLKAAVAGGDTRQVYVAEALGEKGFLVKTYGLLKDPEHSQVKRASSLKETLKDADLIAAPVPFLKQGRIQGQEFSIDLTEENFLKYLKKGSLFCAGGIPEDFLKKAGEKGIRCFDYLKDPFTAMENTIATAEGAIAQAILRSPENLRGSSSLVIGYGRCGRTLAGYLQNMFCRTMVWEKDREKAAQAKAAGLEILEERELPRALTLPAFLFQTAPCVVLKKDLLKYIRKDTCIIDIASLPGGLDYPAAEELGLSPLHLPGIPGKYAPKASGEILALAAIRRIYAAGGLAMELKGKKIGVALTGSFCTYKKVFQELEKLAEEGAQIQTIFSDTAQSIDSRFGKAEDFVKEAERITGRKPMLTISEAEPIGPGSLLDLLILFPCTGNTIAKLANGITDTPALMAAKAHLRNEKPLLLSISTNDALGMNMKNIGLLLNAKHIYFIPFGQDNPQKKPNSMIAHTELLIPAAKAALEGKQYQPLILGA